MGGLKFDPKKLKIVDISSVVANTWNPKQENTEEYQKIKEGIRIKGLRLPIVVRERGEKFEIIDGEQRWESCRELGFEKIWIYSEGNLSDKEAKELTIWYQQQVPFDEISLAKLVSDMSLEFKDLELPFTPEKMEEFKELMEFNFDDFQKQDIHDIDFVTLTFRMQKEQAEVVHGALDRVKNGEDITDERALELICADFLSDPDFKEDITTRVAP